MENKIEFTIAEGVLNRGTLEVKSLTAEYINSPEEYKISIINGDIVLAYANKHGRKSKNTKAIALSNSAAEKLGKALIAVSKVKQQNEPKDI